MIDFNFSKSKRSKYGSNLKTTALIGAGATLGYLGKDELINVGNGIKGAVSRASDSIGQDKSMIKALKDGFMDSYNKSKVSTNTAQSIKKTLDNLQGLFAYNSPRLVKYFGLGKAIKGAITSGLTQAAIGAASGGLIGAATGDSVSKASQAALKEGTEKLAESSKNLTEATTEVNDAKALYDKSHEVKSTTQNSNTKPSELTDAQRSHQQLKDKQRLVKANKNLKTAQDHNKDMIEKHTVGKDGKTPYQKSEEARVTKSNTERIEGGAKTGAIGGAISGGVMGGLSGMAQDEDDEFFFFSTKVKSKGGLKKFFKNIFKSWNDNLVRVELRLGPNKKSSKRVRII